MHVPGVETRPLLTLDQVQDELQRLHMEQYGANPVPPLYERLLPLIPQETRGLLMDAIQRVLENRFQDRHSLGELLPHEKVQLGEYINDRVLRVHREMATDAILSSPDCNIAHFDAAIPRIVQRLVEVSSGQVATERLERLGCLFFDTDGTKTLVECTSHSHTCNYLKRIACVLSNPPVDVQMAIDKLGLELETFSVAGDEFVVTVRSKKMVLTTEILEYLGSLLQEAVSTDATLRTCISFDDPAFVMEYTDWTDEQREAYHAGDKAMIEKFQADRATLMPTFKPSVSVGVATFMQGLADAISPDTEEAHSVDALGFNAFHLMLNRSDIDMSKKKSAYRNSPEIDPRERALLTRGKEARQMEQQKADLERQLALYSDVVRALAARVLSFPGFEAQNLATIDRLVRERRITRDLAVLMVDIEMKQAA